MKMIMEEIEAVEQLRCTMIKTAEKRGSLTHPDVIEISQRLDILINDIQLAHFDRYRLVKHLLWVSFYGRYKNQAVCHTRPRV